MLTEAHVYMRRHQGEKVEHFDVSNVIYHKFSHGAVSYMLNGENVNVMLEFEVHCGSVCSSTVFHMTAYDIYMGIASVSVKRTIRLMMRSY